MSNEITKFEVGQTYEMCSVCNYDSVWTYRVVKRTKYMVTLQQIVNGADRGETTRHRIDKKMSEYFGSERVMPTGSYSMAPILTAEKVAK